jgi:hypothetical protein
MVNWLMKFLRPYMANDLYLIAHRVRGEPAFDIAERIPCFMCQTQESVTGALIEPRWPQAECTECDGLGYQWQIPTSGHRAYPYWSYLLERAFNVMMLIDKPPSTMPEGLPDHYTTHAAPTLSLADALGLRTAPKAPTAPILRRF